MGKFSKLNDSSGSQNSDSNSCKRKIKGRYLQDLNPIPVDPVIDPEFGSCFNCWEFSHTFQICSQPKLQMFCYNCGRQGERVDTCPRCCDAYDAYKKHSLERNHNHSQNYSEEVAYHEKQIEDRKDEFQLYKTFTCSSSETGEEYISCEEEESYDSYIVDEDQKSSNSTTSSMIS